MRALTISLSLVLLAAVGSAAQAYELGDAPPPPAGPGTTQWPDALPSAVSEGYGDHFAPWPSGFGAQPFRTQISTDFRAGLTAVEARVLATNGHHLIPATNEFTFLSVGIYDLGKDRGDQVDAIGIGQKITVPFYFSNPACMSKDSSGIHDITVGPTVSWAVRYGLNRHVWVPGVDGGLAATAIVSPTPKFDVRVELAGGYRADWIGGEVVNAGYGALGLGVAW